MGKKKQITFIILYQVISFTLVLMEKLLKRFVKFEWGEFLFSHLLSKI
jgi:hypothetical protein